jgi:(2Fe-2S) ferredoxin
MPKPQKHVFICTQSRPEDHPKGSCAARGAPPVIDAFRAELESRDLLGRFKVSSSGCLGVCEQGPVALVYPEGVMYRQITEADVNVIIDEHLLGDKPVERLKVPAEVWE